MLVVVLVIPSSLSNSVPNCIRLALDKLSSIFCCVEDDGGGIDCRQPVWLLVAVVVDLGVGSSTLYCTYR